MLGVQEMNIWLKYLITAAIIVAVSEIAKKSDKLAAFLISLPIMSVLAMLWIFIDNTGDERVAKLSKHATYTFWYVIPTLPMLIVIPILLRKGIYFGFVLLIYSVATFVLFYLEPVPMRSIF